MLKLPTLKAWEDLADPAYRDYVTLADPRRSGSASTMNTIILQSKGWQDGWELLTAIAGNTKRFTHSSSDPIKAVVSGDAVAAMAIDFYASAKIADLGEENLGFFLPEGQKVLDPDPVAIVRGASNRKVAERFIEFVLSPEAQKLLVLPKGAPGGPKVANLDRMAVNLKTYEMTEGKRINPINPFQQKTYLEIDIAKSAKMQQVFNDLLGALHIDIHQDLKEAWQTLIKDGLTPEELRALGTVPVTEAQVLAMADKWDNNVYRNQQINDWVTFAKSKYAKLKDGITAGQ